MDLLAAYQNELLAFVAILIIIFIYIIIKRKNNTNTQETVAETIEPIAIVKDNYESNDEVIKILKNKKQEALQKGKYRLMQKLQKKILKSLPANVSYLQKTISSTKKSSKDFLLKAA